MTKTNNTEKDLYDQLMKVQRCVDSFKDLSENIPLEDRYASVISLITENIDIEFKKLFALSLSYQPKA